MKTQPVAQKLIDAGVQINGYQEGQEHVDGAVYITDSIHVQVPTAGRGYCVVKTIGEGAATEFEHFPARADIASLVADIAKASK